MRQGHAEFVLLLIASHLLQFLPVNFAFALDFVEFAGWIVVVSCELQTAKGFRVEVQVCEDVGAI